MVTLSLTNWYNLFQTSLNCWLKEARPDIKSASIWIDHAYDNIEIGVTYHLFSGGKLRDSKPHQIQELFARKIQEILGAKKRTPKQIAVERRRMHWRGECARKAKARKK